MTRCTLGHRFIEQSNNSLVFKYKFKASGDPLGSSVLFRTHIKGNAAAAKSHTPTSFHAILRDSIREGVFSAAVMQFQISLILSVGLWLVSADTTHVEASSAGLLRLRADAEPAQPAIDCEKLKNLSCTGLNRAKCTLRAWEQGCHQATICKDSKNKKKCCDSRDRIPFDAGYFYTGYMRACAPEYELKMGDRPQHKWFTCHELDTMNYAAMEKRMTALHNWEQAGCKQARLPD
ncbi:uncharacterized protein MAM_01773 [Metarhizium album ARSEF 1941]|uniref:Uncharacterized protein n=1 Tax=Metarhizium album (strain ARSEF 1941) TaxID=1081103 RepID=A0A0B2X687_METAS|nr:uncharacterized protein MAM_01773 [Metarhizium album ARSEF 1941]KHO00995.1 hypothetical protein MAM_01773 [Metarhizium album ARSEF 1941]